MEEEKTYSIYDGSEGVYYVVNDFDEYLNVSLDELKNAEDFHDITYIATKFQAQFLKAMESLKEQGLIKRQIIDGDENISIDIVDDLMMDVDLHDLIKNLNNSVEIYGEYFDETKLISLNSKVDETWDNFTRDNEEFLNT